MSSPLPADDSSDAADQAAVFPLLSEKGNRRLIVEWIESHDSYTLVDPDQSVTTAAFDCCILDGEMLQTHAETLRARKREAEPALLPCLLLIPEADLSLIETDRGEIADSVVFETADEVVSMPIKKAELEWRIKALVRLRSQSVRLKERTKTLELFKQAVESSGHAIWISDTDGTINYVNSAFESVTGYSHDETVGHSPELLSSGEMSDGYYSDLWETITAGDPWREEITNQRRDGSQYVADQTIAPVIEDGEPRAFIAVQTDITDHKNLEQRLSLYRDVVERLDDPIMLQTSDGVFRLVNDALCSFAGLSRDELLGGGEYEFMDAATATKIARQKQRVIETEQPVEYTVEPTFTYTDKEAVFYTSRYPYYEDGDLAGTLAVCRDVTDLENRTRQLRVFDNILRHNIRNDVNVIRGRGKQLQAALDGEHKAAADVIVNRANALLTTSEKSRAITDSLGDPHEPESIDLAQVVQRCAAETTADWSEVTVAVSGPDQLLVSASASIDDAVEELLTNAVVHNDANAPTVSVNLAVDEPWGVLRVRDNGPGIPEFDKNVLESGGAIETLSHGSGLGLWLVYWTVTHSGGHIHVADCEPTGTEISISLPLVDG
jgi:PAS domain S-box-containing protein